MRLTKRAAIAALAGTIAAPWAAAASAQELKLGAVNPSSGALALYGDEVTRGYELAADAANAKGGVLGRKVVVVRGNASSPQEGIAAVEQFVSRDKVDVLIGTYISAVANARRASASSGT